MRLRQKVLGLFAILIFLIGIFAVATPVSAHFTLGDLTRTYRYHANDFDPHVAGPVGYVWPGGGLNTYSGFPNYASVNQPPGYQSPYPGGKPGGPGVHGPGAVSVSAPDSSWYQLEGDSYSPFGAILAGSTGDLIFAVNSTCTSYVNTGGVNIGSPGGGAGICNTSVPPRTGPTGPQPFPNGGLPAGGRWEGITILLPPGFSVPDSNQIVTTITNDYTGIAVARVSPYDRYGPGWTMIEVFADAGRNSIAPYSPIPCITATCTDYTSSPSATYYDHQMIDFTARREWYYIRINGVLAPSIAGRYFFKIFLNGGTGSICGQEGTANGLGGLPGEECSQFIPTENWPVLLVKGEVDPAIITGTIRYAGYNNSLYSQPIKEAGRVYAKMTTRLDPYTGQARPDLPKVDALGYFNATANGHYEVEGVAPGVYDLYASAMGYPQTLIASGITILRGQSLHFDGYLQPGPVIHGNVFTKHQFGDEPWPINSPRGCQFSTCYYDTPNPNTYIKIELYDAPTVSHKPSSRAHMVSWSPVPCVAGGQQQYGDTQDAGFCADPRDGSFIGAPWHEYVPTNGYWAGKSLTDPTCANPNCFQYYQVSTGNNVMQANPTLPYPQSCPTPVDSTGSQACKRTQDPQGVGPPQHWYVLGGTTVPFHYEFGVKGEYGAPRDLDGMVPQVYATWVNGLTPGRYYARAWIFRYVQAALDGSTFQEYYFDITPNEWAGDVTLPMDLRLSSWVNKTVHFHNVINGIIEDPIDTGAGMMAGALVDANGNVWSYNQTLLGYKGYYSSGSATGFAPTPGSPPGQVGSAFWKGANVLFPGSVSATLIHENDLDKAKLNRNAIETGRANIQFWGWNDTWGGENYGIPSGTYTPHVFVLGYLEQGPVEQVSVTLSGATTSISDHMYRGVGFNLTVFSIDWQRPRVQRNWIWGNPIGYTAIPVNYAGTTGVPGGLATVGSFPSAGSGGVFSFQGDPRCPNALTTPYTGYGCMVGQEIDIGLYQNGTLVDSISEQSASLPDTALTYCLFQAARNSTLQLCGGGWDPQSLLPWNQTYVNYQGNSNDAYFGQELKDPGYVGGYTGGISYFLTVTILFAPSIYNPTSLPDGGVYSGAVTGYVNLYPSANPPGLYNLRGWTYGYIQNMPSTVYASASQVADVRLNLVIGVNVTLDILFKKEHVITPTSANMSARVRLFNDQSNLVAEWMSSEGTYVTASGFARASDGTDQYPFGTLHPVVLGCNPVPSGSCKLRSINTYNYVPGGITLLHVLMAGLPQVPSAGTNTGVAAIGDPQRVYFNDPILATTTCGFNVNCYTNPGTSLGVGVPGFFPNTGIMGASDYQGGWTAEVDFVNWYQNNTSCVGATWFGATNGCGAIAGSPGIISNTTFTGSVPIYYAPVPGILMGESYHIIPGTTAKSGISLTEDTALNPALIGLSMSPNHLGPYSQQGVWQISNTHNSGEASGIFEVDLNGLVSGNALAFNYANEFRPVSWATISITGAGLPSSGLNFYTYDAHYEAYLPGTRAGAAGSNTYKMTITMPGLAPQTMNVAVSSGMSGTGANVYMQESNIPVPEFNALIITAFSALAASLYLLGRRRKTA